MYETPKCDHPNGRHWAVLTWYLWSLSCSSRARFCLSDWAWKKKGRKINKKRMRVYVSVQREAIGHIRVAVNFPMKARLSTKLFIWKLVLFAWNFRNKNFALSLAFIMRFKATRKWPIVQHKLSKSKRQLFFPTSVLYLLFSFPQ